MSMSSPPEDSATLAEVVCEADTDLQEMIADLQALASAAPPIVTTSAGQLVVDPHREPTANSVGVLSESSHPGQSSGPEAAANSSGSSTSTSASASRSSRPRRASTQILASLSALESEFQDLKTQVVVTSASTTKNVAAVAEMRRQSMARIEQVGESSAEDLAMLVAAVDEEREEDQAEQEEEPLADGQQEQGQEGNDAQDPGVARGAMEHDAVIQGVCRDPEALLDLMEDFDASVDSMIGEAQTSATARPAPADTIRSVEAPALVASTGTPVEAQTMKVRLDGRWWQVPVSAAAPPPVPRANAQAAAATAGTSFISRLEHDLTTRKDKAMAIAVARAKQVEEERQLAVKAKVSKVSQRIGHASGVEVLAMPVEHKRSDTRHQQEICRHRPGPVAFESPLVTAQGLVLTRQNQADSRTSRSHTGRAGRDGTTVVTNRYTGIAGSKGSKKVKKRQKRDTKRTKVAAPAAAAAAEGSDKKSGDNGGPGKASVSAVALVNLQFEDGFPVPPTSSGNKSEEVGDEQNDGQTENSSVALPRSRPSAAEHRKPTEKHSPTRAERKMRRKALGIGSSVSEPELELEQDLATRKGHARDNTCSSCSSSDENENTGSTGHAELLERRGTTSKKQQVLSDRLLGMLSIICDELGLDFSVTLAQQPTSPNQQKRRDRHRQRRSLALTDIGAARQLLITACEQLELPRLSMQLMLDNSMEVETTAAAVDAVLRMGKQATLVLQELGIEAVPPSSSDKRAPPQNTTTARRAHRRMTSTTTSKRRTRHTARTGTKADSRRGGGANGRQADLQVHMQHLRPEDGSDDDMVMRKVDVFSDIHLQLDGDSVASAGADWLEQTLGLSPLTPMLASPRAESSRDLQVPRDKSISPEAVATTAQITSASKTQPQQPQHEHAKVMATVPDLLASLARASPHANTSVDGNLSDRTALEPAERRRAGAMDDELEQMRQQVAALRTLSTDLASTVARQQRDGTNEGNPNTTDLRQLVSEAQHIAAAVSAVGEAAGDYLISRHQEHTEATAEAYSSSPLPLTHEIRAARRILHGTGAMGADASSPMNADDDENEQRPGAESASHLRHGASEHEDVTLLRAFYRYYVPPFGSGFDDARIRLIISSFRNVAMQRGHDDWKEWMYRTIEQKHGVDPRSCAPQPDTRRCSESLHTPVEPFVALNLNAEEKEEGDASDSSSDSYGSGVSAFGGPSKANEADAIAELRQMAIEHGNRSS